MAKTFRFKTEYLNDDGIVEIGRYGDSSLALRLSSVYGEPLAMPTVCLEEYGEIPTEGNVFLRAYSENEGMPECLQKLGIVGPPIRTVAFGPYDASAVECKLLLPESDMRVL